MKVYVLETGCYSDRWTQGVYATVEAAQAACPKGVWNKDEHDVHCPNRVTWSNGSQSGPDLLPSELATIQEFEVQ